MMSKNSFSDKNQNIYLFQNVLTYYNVTTIYIQKLSYKSFYTFEITVKLYV